MLCFPRRIKTDKGICRRQLEVHQLSGCVGSRASQQEPRATSPL